MITFSAFVTVYILVADLNNQQDGSECLSLEWRVIVYVCVNHTVVHLRNITSIAEIKPSEPANSRDKVITIIRDYLQSHLTVFIHCGMHQVVQRRL